MFNKPFISLYILPDCLYLVQLSGDRRKLKLNLRLDLPKGLIKDYKVTDSAAFAQMLLAIWRKYKIRDRWVACVIPEFAAFTKRLSLPKVPISELHEAVIWQAQDFLPMDLEQMLLDWKVISQNDSSIEVFVVAIRREVLMSYVEAFERAKLYPIYVETPSLSLARLDKKTTEGTLFVYADAKESIVGIAQFGTMVASSVVRGNDPSVLMETIKKITAHYKMIPITTINIGGIADTLVSPLEKQFGKKTNWLSLPIKNVPNETIQNYLLPLSLSSTPLTLPQDPNTINLLPHVLVEQYQSKKSKVQFWGVILTVTLFVWICLLAGLGAYLYLSQSIKNIQNTSVAYSGVDQKRQDAVKLAKDINGLTANILAIKKIVVNPAEVLNQIEMTKPDGVTITSYKLDFDTADVRIGGLAKDRLTLIEFKQNLGKQTIFGSVDLPISNFETDTNLEFAITAVYVPLSAAGQAQPKKK